MFLDGSDKKPENNENTPPANNDGNTNTPIEWLKGVEESLMNEPSVRIQKDLNSLVKSYVSAQKAMGAEKVSIPKKDATPEQWNEFYKRIGLPEAEDKYGLTRDEKSSVDEAFFNEFKKSAFAAGILPHQAQALLTSFEGISKRNVETLQNNANEVTKSQIEELKREWGEAYDGKLEIIKETVDKFGGDELRAVLKQAGLGANPTVAKLFVQIGESLLEKTPKGMKDTPAETSRKLEDILADNNHPYHNPAHIGHAAAVKEVEALFQKQYK